jgi:hypothetical protein
MRWLISLACALFAAKTCFGTMRHVQGECHSVGR